MGIQALIPKIFMIKKGDLNLWGLLIYLEENKT